MLLIDSFILIFYGLIPNLLDNSVMLLLRKWSSIGNNGCCLSVLVLLTRVRACCSDRVCLNLLFNINEGKHVIKTNCVQTPNVGMDITLFFGLQSLHMPGKRPRKVVWRSRPSALNAGEDLVCLASTTCSRAQRIGAYQSDCRTAN